MATPTAEPAVVLPLWSRIIFTCADCFVVGYADAICFRQFNTFAAMQTGNLICLGTSIFFPTLHESDLGVPEPVWRFLMIVAFLFGVVMHRIMRRFAPRSVKISATIWLMLAMVVVTCGLNGAGFYRRWIRKSWDCVGLAMVFGVQTAASTLGGLNSTTTLVTMHIRDFGCFLVKFCSCEAKRQDRLNALISGGAPVSLLLGVLVGSCGVRYKDRALQPEILLLFVAPTLLVLMVVQDHLWKRQRKIQLKEMELAGTP